MGLASHEVHSLGGEGGVSRCRRAPLSSTGRRLGKKERWKEGTCQAKLTAMDRARQAQGSRRQEDSATQSTTRNWV